MVLNLEPNTIWASRSERVYVLRVGRSKNICSPRTYVDYYVPGIGEKWLELSEFLSRYHFLAEPKLKYSEICSDENLSSPPSFNPRLL